MKEQYKQMRPDMGIVIIKSSTDNKCYIEGTQNLRSTMNRAKFQLNLGNHPIKQLQEDWNQYGEEKFTVEIFEKLEYDKDESKVDYKDDLDLLLMICEEKLSKKNIEFYKK
ncbi:hypothetical protein Curi_c00880 [Gottschalkia acidurici 9a]|uniref:GIY-YIG domain-containing protein n=2 Tax=Clostridium acidurici TaxID=1556 RepID=K0AV76_GOTA9|nr:hypothetical protein Curi_c00880 [Gottschalkia acidurici 9a]